ncbi:hypothetical protein [Thermococcus barossii]|nr:hypothetical protein [Thermococcus barossii]
MNAGLMLHPLSMMRGDAFEIEHVGETPKLPPALAKARAEILGVL